MSEVVVITGASRGLGAGMAQWFSQNGKRTGLCSRSTINQQNGPEVFSDCVDVTDEEGVEQFLQDVVAALGPIDLWINNAGVLDPILPLRDLSHQAMRDHFDINVMGVLACSRAYIRHRRSVGGGGVLINISSGAALKGYAGWSAYCAGKAAVDRMTECISLEESGFGLRAHAVAPGVVDTQMQEKIRGSSPAVFPMVNKFLKLKERDAFNSPAFVAEHINRIATGEWTPGAVVVRIPNEV